MQAAYLCFETAESFGQVALLGFEPRHVFGQFAGVIRRKRDAAQGLTTQRMKAEGFGFVHVVSIPRRVACEK